MDWPGIVLTPDYVLRHSTVESHQLVQHLICSNWHPQRMFEVAGQARPPCRPRHTAQGEFAEIAYDDEEQPTAIESVVEAVAEHRLGARRCRRS